MTAKVHSLTNNLGPAVLCASLLLPLATGVACSTKATTTSSKTTATTTTSKVTDEVTTAATHAGIAAKSTTIDAVHKHMHHALNCLVGPEGVGFDAEFLDPCKDMGHGAIADASDPNQRKQLEQIADTLRAGLDENSLDTVQNTAAAAESSLTKVATK